MKKKQILTSNSYYLIKHLKQTRKPVIKKKKKVQPTNLLTTKYSHKYVSLFLHPTSIKYLFISRLFKKSILKRLASN